MRSIASRSLVSALVATAAVGGAAAAAATRAADAPKPPKTITATQIRARPGTLNPGSHVRASAIVGQRVFTDSRHGFALASVSGADYPVATADDGKTWKTAGPALHLHALQAPLAVVFIGAVRRTTVFAWGGGQAIDTTSDGGKHWYRALFPNGTPVAVAQDLQHHLVAFVASFNGTATSRYTSTDGGRTWHH
jgi:hypothetical protein